jgi:hypothetical protein
MEGTFLLKNSPKNVSLNSDEILTFNFSTENYEKIKIIKIYSGNHIDGYTTENNLLIKDELVKFMKDFDNNIFEKETKVYGNVPYRIKCVFYDIKDNYTINVYKDNGIIIDP